MTKWRHESPEMVKFAEMAERESAKLDREFNQNQDKDAEQEAVPVQAKQSKRNKPMRPAHVMYKPPTTTSSGSSAESAAEQLRSLGR